MIHKLLVFAAALTLALAQPPASAQYGPPTSGSSAAILFTPATVNLVAGLNGEGSSGNGGLATAAQLNYPVGIAYDSSGNLFVADGNNYVVRRIDHTTGDISIFAGTNATFGNSLGGGVATSAQLGIVAGLVIDTSNNVYVSDRSNNVVWKITAAGTISVYAGGGSGGLGDGGPATSAELSNPWALGIDASNNIYIADSYNDLIRVVNHSTNIITTFAGVVADAGGYGGCSAGSLYSTSTPPYTPTQAHLCFPEGIAFDSSGNAYIVDEGNKIVRVVNKSTGYISTFAGGGTQAASVNNIPATSASLSPSGVFVDPGNRVYIADSGGGLVRVVDSTGNINTVFGNGFGDLTAAAIGLPDTQSIVYNVGPADGIYDMAMDTFGNLIAASSSGVTITSAGTAGQYRFPQTPIFTTETTTQANATSTYYPPYVTISNPSGVALNLAAAPVVTGPFAIVTGTGAGTCVFPGTVAAGQSCTLVLSFTPTLGGSPGTVQTGTIVITSNANSTPSTITLYGTGTGTATVSATLTPSPLTFTSPAGVTSAAQTATLTNTGQIPIAIGSTDFDFTSAINFALSATTCPSGSATLAVGASCTYSITFTPSAATTYIAGFQACITTSSYGCLQSITVEGTGTAGATATLLPTPIAFGSVVLGQTSAPMSATLSNTSSSPITISSFSITGTNPADFAITTGTNACGSTLAASSSCIVYVTFTPATAASFSAQLSVSDSATGSPQSAALTGTGISFVSNVGTALAAQAVTVLFTTPGTLNSIQTLTQGAPNLDFTFASGGTCTTGTAYTVGQYCTVDIVFKPQSPGLRSGELILVNSTGSVLGTTALPGTGIGPQIGFLPGILTVLGGGFNGPQGVVANALGDVFVADTYNYAIKEIPPGCLSAACVTTLVGSGINEPDGIAMDSAGNLYVASAVIGTVSEILAVNGVIPASPTVITLSSSFGAPYAVAVDGNRNVYVADTGDNAVKEILAVNGVIPASPTIVTLGSGFSNPSGVTVDKSGNAYVADRGNLVVKEILAVNGVIPASPTIVTLGSGFTTPTGVALDSGGNLYVADEGADAVKELLAVGGVIPASPTIVTLNNTLNRPSGLAVDANGNVYVANFNNQTVVEIDYSNAPAVTFATATAIGTTDTADGPQKVTVQNSGNASLTFTGIALGTNFKIDAATTTCSTSSPIAAGASCVVGVDFAPTATGALTGTLTLTDNALNVTGTTQLIALSGTGSTTPTPQAVLTPTSLPFPNTAVGVTSAGLTTVLSNPGTATLTITGITITGTNPSSFAQTNNCPASLAVSATCTISVTFTPGSATALSASISVADNATGSPQAVTITGTGTAALAPLATLSPTTLIFPSTTVGVAATSLPVTLSNPGTAALTIGSITITGTDAGSFAQTNNCGTSLAAATSCKITVSFTPSATGSLTAAISVADNASGSPQSVTLTGAGAAPQAVLSPNPLAFPTTTVGVSATPLPVTLSNPGNAALTITGISITGTSASSFGETNTCGSSLAAAATCIITVSFTPASAASLSAAISVADNASGSPQSAALTGTGAAPLIPQAVLTPNPLAFSSTTINTSATPLPMTLSNPGNTALAITGISVTGANASNFGETNTCGSSLAPAATCTITVTFAPTSAATLTAAISVADNAAGSPQSAVITGIGSAGTYTVNSSTPTQSVQPGGVAQYNILVAPLGGSFNNLVTLSATGLPAGAQVSFLPPAVTPGSSGAPSVMSIQTATGLARLALPESQRQSPIPLLALLAGVPLLGLAGSLRRLRKSSTRWMLLSLIALSILPILAFSGCGGGYFGPAPQTYTVNVVGTSGTLQESTTITLTVQ